MSVLDDYLQLPSGFWVRRRDGAGPYFVDVENDTATAAGSTSGQGGTVTNTLGSLTSNDVILGNGGDDVKRVPGISSDGVSKLKLGEAGSTVGGIELRNGTSGSVTIQPVTGALGTVTLQAPAADGVIATTANITDAVAGLSWKSPCRVATTVAGTLASSFENGDTVDGVVLATNDRILIKNQAAGAENGLYTVNASGAPTRTTDADTGTEILNASVLVTAGTTNANRQYTCNTPGPITLGSTSLTFVQINASGGSVATDPIWQAAGDDVQGTGVGTAARLALGTPGQVQRVNAGGTAREYYTPPASGATDATAAEILALTTGDEGVIYHATSSSGVVVEDGYYIWNEYVGELQQLVAVTPAEAVAISDGFQGHKTWAAMQALSAVEGMTCSTDFGNVVSYWRYNGTFWTPLGGSQLVFATMGAKGQTTGPGNGTEVVLTGCQVALPLKSLWATGAAIRVIAGAEKLNGSAESPTMGLRMGTAGTIADALLAGAFTFATTSRVNGLNLGASRDTTDTTIRLDGNGSITAQDRFSNSNSVARPAAITVGDMDSATNYLSLTATATTPFAEYITVNKFCVWIEGY